MNESYTNHVFPHNTCSTYISPLLTITKYLFKIPAHKSGILKRYSELLSNKLSAASSLFSILHQKNHKQYHKNRHCNHRQHIQWIQYRCYRFHQKFRIRQQSTLLTVHLPKTQRSVSAAIASRRSSPSALTCTVKVNWLSFPFWSMVFSMVDFFTVTLNVYNQLLTSELDASDYTHSTPCFTKKEAIRTNRIASFFILPFFNGPKGRSLCTIALFQSSSKTYRPQSKKQSAIDLFPGYIANHGIPAVYRSQPMIPHHKPAFSRYLIRKLYISAAISLLYYVGFWKKFIIDPYISLRVNNEKTWSS